MTKYHTVLVLLLALPSGSQAAEWFAAPDATATGNGTSNLPWPLRIALTNRTRIQPGDTLYLRGGRYIGPRFQSSLSGTSNNYVTIRSAPREWATITDGATWTLKTALPMATNGQTSPYVVFEGSELFPDAGNWIKIGTENSYAYAKQSSNAWRLDRGYDITNHSMGEAARVYGPYIIHTGSYVRFMDFEITSTAYESRVVDTRKADDTRTGLNFPSNGKGNKAINLIIHNVGHPAIGFWNQADGGEINGCLLWGNGVYDYNGTWIRGDGVYAQNETGQVFFKNNILFRNFTLGLDAFGETGPVSGFVFANNISFDTPANPLSFAARKAQMSNNAMLTNYVQGTIVTGYVSTNNRLLTMVGNVAVDSSIDVKEFVSGTFAHNTIFLPHSGQQSGQILFECKRSAAKQDLAFYWDYNSYYLDKTTGTDQWIYTTLDVVPKYALPFDSNGTNSWKAQSGFDSHGTNTIGWPSNYFNLAVQPLDYDTNRWHICVISTSARVEADLNLADYGFAIGDQFRLHDAQNWPTRALFGRYHGGSIKLPLTLTNVSDIPHMSHYTNAHTNMKRRSLFNAFILYRNPTGTQSELGPGPEIYIQDP